MTARQKLNRFHVIGSLGMAAIIGGLTGSWLVFGVVAVLLIAGSIHTGEIRPDKGTKR